MSKDTLKDPSTALRFSATTDPQNILLLLILYIFLFDFSVLSYCIYIIFTIPKLPISIFVFQVRMPIQYH